jgi:hypothetical protein
MTEPENPRKQERGFSRSLESAKNKGALFHIPSAPAAAATLSQNPTQKGAFLRHQRTPSLRLILRLEKTVPLPFSQEALTKQ